MLILSAFTLSLNSMDGLRDFNSLETENERSGNFVTLYIVPGLPPNRLWDYTIMAYGCQQVTVLSGNEISKLVLEIYLHDMFADLMKTIVTESLAIVLVKSFNLLCIL